MSVTTEELRAAFASAEDCVCNANSLAKVAIRFAVGRLRQLDLDRDDLQALKRELQSFHGTRRRWKPRR